MIKKKKKKKKNRKNKIIITIANKRETTMYGIRSSFNIHATHFNPFNLSKSLHEKSFAIIFFMQT